MIRLCAWCGEAMGESVCREHSPDEITHGICAKCYAKEQIKLDELKTIQEAVREREATNV